MNQQGRILVALALAVGSYTYFAAAPHDAGGESASRLTKRVKVGAVTAATDQRELRFAGVTRAAQRARLAFAVGGRLLERKVEVGDTVRRGQVLARVDDLEMRNGSAAAKAALAELGARRGQLERDVERVEKLVAAKAATAEELEKTRTGLDAVRAGEEAAQARFRETERWFGETTLKAPFDGVVTEVLAEPGELMSPGRPVILVSGLGEVELEVELPERVTPRLELGQAVKVEVPMLDATLDGKIVSIGRSAAGPGRLFPVIVALSSDKPVAVGATAELLLHLGNDAALAVPVEAVVDPGGRRPAVFKVEGGKVHKVAIEVGALAGRSVVVRGALQAGDQVVVGGQRGLLDGETVEVIP